MTDLAPISDIPTRADRPGDADALFYAGRRSAVLRSVPLSAPEPGEALVRTLWSAPSRGTERLVFEGRVPADERDRMRAPFQEGDFPFPVKYGYCAVGVVEEGSADLLGRTVFCLHPHQTRFVVPESALALVPDKVPARRAVLAANMETALNAVWDSGVAPGARAMVVGGGVLGLLVCALIGRMPGVEATLVDVDPARAPLAAALGCGFSKPLDAPGEMDVVFHASANPAGLSCALACAGDEARIVEMSWYGSQPAPVPLGLAFHSRRLQIVSSQVGRIAPLMRPRWDYARRLAKALDLLDDPRLDALITHEIAFADLPAALPALLAPGAPGLCVAVSYA
ncbi:MAG: zinc-binding alcohol dehydrogenase [Microvirga sp.]|nr:zinc-binding alcohol dehydrogenase [Microvirga sp.]